MPISSKYPPARVVVFSGGLDSTTLLWLVKQSSPQDQNPLPTRCLTFNYGQRHYKEIDQARIICREIAGVDWALVEMQQNAWLISSGSQLDLNTDVPTGHYAEESMKQTVVPNRNMMMLSIAVAHCIATKSPYLYYAAHAGDHAIYPDCRPDFVIAMRSAIQRGNYNGPELLAPFLNKTKADIVALGAALGAPFLHTWSCYQGGEVACGKCGTCVERLEAFDKAGVKDPIPYADREWWKGQVKV